jgi:hypothetical protein
MVNHFPGQTSSSLVRNSFKQKKHCSGTCGTYVLFILFFSSQFQAVKLSSRFV